VRLTAAARRLGGEIGAVFALPERARFDRALSASRKALSPADFEAAWESGERLGLADAIAAANVCLGATDPLVPGAGEGQVTTPAKGTDTGLSARELEVLRLMADGMSNQQIADRLFVSQRTVSNHVSSILSKLQFGSRTAAVAYAIRSGIA
jgi:DNA-binding NarL/FixJ family response regulator